MYQLIRKIRICWNLPFAMKLILKFQPVCREFLTEMLKFPVKSFFHSFIGFLSTYFTFNVTPEQRWSGCKTFLIFPILFRLWSETVMCEGYTYRVLFPELNILFRGNAVTMKRNVKDSFFLFPFAKFPRLLRMSCDIQIMCHLSGSMWKKRRIQIKKSISNEP